MNKNYKTLELDKILHMLSLQARCEDTKNLALNIEPSTEFNYVQHNLELTNNAFTLSMKYGSPTILAVKNIKNATKRADLGASLTPIELLEIAEALRIIRGLCQYRSSADEERLLIDDWFDTLSPNKFLEDKINNAIISEDEIADGASPELSDIRRKMRGCSQGARAQLDKLIKNPAYQKFLQENIITIRDSRFVVPVKSEYKNEIKGLVHDTSASGATLFIEPIAVVEINNELKILKAKEEQEIARILSELSADVANFHETISTSYDALIMIDLVFAKANLGIKMRGCIPIFSNDGIIDLKKARHPLIEKDKVVPIDVSLGKNFDTLVITGPNTGGKTVTLKTLGLFVLMTMCGLMIPCAEQSRVCIFEKVLADIGDEQSIEQSLSTFSSHIKNIVEILQKADHNSLVLIDELGAGTDPVEGAALAVSIIKKLRSQNAKIAATTHYSEIKKYAFETDGVENACCEFDVSTLSPTYKLLIGVPGRSNAFAISTRLGISNEIIDDAKKLVSSENSRFERVVVALEETRQNLVKEEEKAVELRIQAETREKEISAFKAKLEKEKEIEIEKARELAKKIVNDTKISAEKLLNEIEEIKKKKDSADFSKMASEIKSHIKSDYSKLEELADPVTKKTQIEYKLPRPLKVGDSVYLFDLQKKGIVLSLSKDNTVLVQSGIIKTTVPIASLQLIDEKENIQPKPGRRNITRNVKSKLTNDFKTELDLRGYMVEEALLELDRFIDDCVLSSLSQVTIIHGKGTGALRSAVQSALRSNKSVRTFRLGVYGEGETGVTIVELK